MSNPYAYVIILLHAGFAGALLLLERQQPSRFIQLFAWSWAVEAIRAAILLPEVNGLGGRSDLWFCLADVLCFVANWFILSACAALVAARLPRWLAPVYLGTGIPIVLMGRYAVPILGQSLFDWSRQQGVFYGVLGNLVAMFLPVTATRMLIVVWLWKLWKETRMPGALVATIFCVPYAVVALAVPVQFYYSYNPPWISFLWAFRVFGFSLGVLMLLFSRQQRTVEQGEERLRRATDLANIGTWDWNVVTGEVQWSERMGPIHGLPPGVMKASWAGFVDFVHPDDRRAFAKAVNSSLAENTRLEFEYRVVLADGTQRWVMVSGSAVRDAQGRAVHMLGVLQDVHERREAENALRKEQENAERYLSVAEVILVAFNTEARVTLLNRKGHLTLGYENGELTGRNWFRVCLPEEEYEKALGAYKLILAGALEPIRYYEHHIVRKDGMRRLIAWHNSMLRDEQGRIIGSLSSGEDITDRRQAEQALQTSLREKEALLKEVHHRVKNNLQVINSLLRLESARSAQPDTKAVLLEMQGRIRSMALLHESLYRSASFAAVDLGVYLRQLALQSFRALAPEHSRISLELDLASIHVGMDQAIACGLIVNELISNCLKHGFPSGRQGEVRIELQTLGEGPHLCIRVSDTGIGLPAEFESLRSRSLGLQLVADLAVQIAGVLTIGTGKTAVFEVVFKTSHPQSGANYA